MFRNVLIILAAVLAISTMIIGVYLTPDDLASCKSEPSDGRCRGVDAIVTISGGNTQVRVEEAIRLYENGWADTLIFSGAARDTSGPSNAAVMRSQAVEAGVPAEAIEIEESSQTTKQNAEKTQQLLDRVPGGDTIRIILVTSGYHQRRASLEFGSLTGDNIEIINHPAPNDPDWPVLWWLTPRGWWLAIGELIKIMAFYAGQSQ